MNTSPTPLDQYDRQRHLAHFEAEHPDADHWPPYPRTNYEAAAYIAQYTGRQAELDGTLPPRARPGEPECGASEPPDEYDEGWDCNAAPVHRGHHVHWQSGLPVATWPQAASVNLAPRGRACPLCGTPAGEPCQPKPSADHLARYLDAYTAGQVTRAYLAMVLGELVVIDEYAVIPAGAR